VERSIADIDLQALTAGRAFFPSPAAWEDQVLYFLMLDRFSSGQENEYRDNNGALVTTGTTPLFRPSSLSASASRLAFASSPGTLIHPLAGGATKHRQGKL